jgi:hypothetical protein
MQNNKKRCRRSANIVQDDTTIVQAPGNNAFLDDFVMEFGRLFHSFWAKVFIFAAVIDAS